MFVSSAPYSFPYCLHNPDERSKKRPSSEIPDLTDCVPATLYPQPQYFQSLRNTYLGQNAFPSGCFNVQESIEFPGHLIIELEKLKLGRGVSLNASSITVSVNRLIQQRGSILTGKKYLKIHAGTFGLHAGILSAPEIVLLIHKLWVTQGGQIGGKQFIGMGDRWSFDEGILCADDGITIDIGSLGLKSHALLQALGGAINLNVLKNLMMERSGLVADNGLHLLSYDGRIESEESYFITPRGPLTLHSLGMHKGKMNKGIRDKGSLFLSKDLNCRAKENIFFTGSYIQGGDLHVLDADTLSLRGVKMEESLAATFDLSARNHIQIIKGKEQSVLPVSGKIDCQGSLLIKDAVLGNPSGPLVLYAQKKGTINCSRLNGSDIHIGTEGIHRENPTEAHIHKEVDTSIDLHDTQITAQAAFKLIARDVEMKGAAVQAHNITVLIRKTGLFKNSIILGQEKISLRGCLLGLDRAGKEQESTGVHITRSRK